MNKISLPCLHSSFHNACPHYLKSRQDLLYTSLAYWVLFFFPLWVLWLSGEWAVGIGVIFDGEDVGAAAIWLLCSKNDASEVTIWKSNAESYYIDKDLGHGYTMKVHSKEKTSTNFGLVSCPVGRVICGFLSRDDNGKSTWLRYSGVNEVKIYCCEIPKTSSARRTRR